MMEPLSLLRLSSPKRPHGPHIISSGYTAAVQSESGSAFSTPYTSAPSSPRRTVFFFREDVEEPPLGEVRAAVPFLWEEVPGTPRRDDQIVSVAAEAAAAVREKDAEVYEAQLAREDDYSFEFVAGARQVEAAEDGSEDVSGELSVDSESDSGFEFTARRRFANVTNNGAAELVQAGNSTLQSINTTTTPHYNMSTADELFFKGRVLPLRLPPRLLQSPKQQQLLQTISDSSCSSSFDDSSSAGSSAAKSSDLSSGRRRMRSSKSRLLIFLGCGQLNEEEAGADVETLMLQGIEESDTATTYVDERRGQYERRRTSPQRGTLSPRRLFKNQANSRSDEKTAEAILDLSFSEYSSAVVNTSLEGLKLDSWPQYKEKTGRQGKLRELLEYHHQPDRANRVESPNKELLHGNVSSLASPADQRVLPSLPGIAEIDMKNSVMSFKESTERSNSRLQTLGRNPLLPRKLRSSSSSPRSAVSSDLHVKSFPLHQIRRTLFRGCLGSTPTIEEQEFADVYKSPSPGLRSQKVL
ncbi:unnamed protein product [Sphagnum jensenii]|uniref:Uncharacterized protein n=1 Tax=Sphagnum jensenii TaxID=128206 RepID=A0ABP1BD58_9BRYO